MKANMMTISSLSKSKQWRSEQSMPFCPSFDMNYSRHITAGVREGNGYA